MTREAVENTVKLKIYQDTEEQGKVKSMQS